MNWKGSDTIITSTEEEINKFLSKNTLLIMRYFPELLISFDEIVIKKYIEDLELYSRYSFIYYLTSRNETIDCDDPLIDIKNFDIIDNYQNKINMNKKFFNPKKLKMLDHGNHTGKVIDLNINTYKQSNLVLLHFHNRGVRKLIEKCKRDINGLQKLNNIYDINNISILKKSISKNVTGVHNIVTYIQYLEYGPNSLCLLDDECVYMQDFSNKINDLRNLYTKMDILK
jgi:hypothetical protein